MNGVNEPVVVVVEDDPAIANLLDMYLRKEGFRPLTAGDGERGLALVAQHDPVLAVLDIGLPDVDGFEVCRRMRAVSDVPVLFLTARDDEVDRIAGFDVGADDYVVKPFSPKEVVARVRAVLRRSRAVSGTAPVVSGRLTIDLERHTVAVAGATAELTPKEFDLLRALAEARGRVLSREFLLDRVWGYAAAGEIESRTVDVHVRRLRVKLGDEGARITTVKGVGYRLEPED